MKDSMRENRRKPIVEVNTKEQKGKQKTRVKFSFKLELRSIDS